MLVYFFQEVSINFLLKTINLIRFDNELLKPFTIYLYKKWKQIFFYFTYTHFYLFKFICEFSIIINLTFPWTTIDCYENGL